MSEEKKRKRHPADITGQVFGRLTAIRPDHYNKYGRPVWLCLCECGNYCEVDRSSLLAERTKSCGCYRRETSAATGHKMGGGGWRKYRTEDAGK